MTTAHSLPLARLVRASFLAVALGGCALTATACGSPSAAPTAQTSANAGIADNTVPTAAVTGSTTPLTTASPPPAAVSASTAAPITDSSGSAYPSQLPAPQRSPGGLGGDQSTTQSTKPPPTQPTQQSGILTAKLIGLPASIAAGSAPIQFQAVIHNPGAVGYTSVAPVFQFVGGPANHVDATLQEYDPVSHAWQATSMPEGDGANPLSFAAHGQYLAPGQTLTVTYRLTVSTQNPAEPTAAILYAAALPGPTQLAQTTVRGRLTAS